MTPSELKAEYYKHNPDGHYFDRKTMKFFGDTMKNYGVKSHGEYWELYRKRPVKYGLKLTHYFHKATFNETTCPEVTK